MATRTYRRRDILGFGLGLGLLGVCYSLAFLLNFPDTVAEDSGNLSRDGFIMLGILLFAATFWILEPIPLAVTGLLVMALQILLVGSIGPDKVFASFGSRAVFFLIGALMLAAAIQKHNVHKRVAVSFLVRFEDSPRRLTVGIFSLSVLLTFFIPLHAVAALMLPILFHILVALELEPMKSNFGKVSMLSMAYGCSIGSLGTLMGGARNPLTIAFINDIPGSEEVTFLGWMVVSLPVVLITSPLVWYVLVKCFPLEDLDISNARKIIEEDVKQLGPLSFEEKKVLGIFFFTVSLWVFGSGFIGVEVAALLGAVLVFVFKVVDWEDIESRMQWGIILLYGGAITMGVNLKDTGAAFWIAGRFLDVAGGSDYVLILILILLTVTLTQMMSNTAAVAMLLPIGYGLSLESGLSPELTSYLIGLSGGLAFMFVIATPGHTIAYSAGYFSLRDIFRAGFYANIIAICIIFLVAISYWKFLGVW